MSGSVDARLKLYLLGQFSVEYAGNRVPQAAWKRRRPVELLTALALAPGHVLHREELIDRLWPSKDLDAGANNLYRTLHDLRKITGDDAVNVERGAVRLHESAWVDVTAFEKAISQPDHRTVASGLELYLGDLLPDDPYSDVIGPRREGLRQRFVDATLRVARDQSVEPNHRISLLRRLVDIDPGLEEGHRLLMTALAEVGRPKDASRQFAACVEALREHLEVGPSTATQKLHERIKSGELAPARAAPIADDNWVHVARRLLGTDRPRQIRGRDRDLATARSFSSSDCGALLIIGEAGAGKTRLAVEAARNCADDGAIILAGLGVEFDGAAPYTPFVDAWTDLVRVVPGTGNPFVSFEPTGGSAQEDRLRLFRAIEAALSELAGSDTVCILIEDLHQADESSLYLFHHLVRASRQLPIKLIGTLRGEHVMADNPLHVLLASLGRERQTSRITLERLDRAGTRELLQDLWAEPPTDEQVDATYRLANGNPFFIEEVASSVRDATPSTSASANVSISDLMATVRGRIRALGGDIDRLLVGASVQSVRFDFEIAREAVGMDAETALDALDGALAARVIEEQDGRYRFRHALMREALTTSLSHARQVHLHRKTAEALEDKADHYVQSEPELLAYHHQRAGNLEAALSYTLRAVSNAQSRLGFGEAVAHGQRALDLIEALGDHHEQRFAVLRQIGAMRVALGDLDQAVENLLAAAELGGGGSWRPSPAQVCGAYRLAGLARIEAGELADAETYLDRALQALGDVHDPGELGSAYYLYSQLRWHQSRHAEAFELAEKCLAVAEETGNVEAIAKGYEMLALACHSLGEWKRGQVFEEQRKEVADGTLDVASAFDVHL